MATFSFTVPDAIVDRILAAFGRWDITTVPPVRVPATPAEIRNVLKNLLKSTTLEYEAGQIALAKRDEVNAEIW
mgnify:CR=1 FL=1